MVSNADMGMMLDGINARMDIMRRDIDENSEAIEGWTEVEDDDSCNPFDDRFAIKSEEAGTEGSGIFIDAEKVGTEDSGTLIDAEEEEEETETEDEGGPVLYVV